MLSTLGIIVPPFFLGIDVHPPAPPPPPPPHFNETVNQKLLYRESDWWDVGLVVQKARKLGTVGYVKVIDIFFPLGP